MVDFSNRDATELQVYTLENRRLENFLERHKAYYAYTGEIEVDRFLREILQKEMPAYFTDTQDLDTTLKNIQDQYTQVLKDAKRIQ